MVVVEAGQGQVVHQEGAEGVSDDLELKQERVALQERKESSFLQVVASYSKHLRAIIMK